jgi:hypothetical protein
VTLLKAFFDVSAAFPSPVDVAVDSHGDERLVPCGATLTLEGELNKLASNVALGRNIAGVHWRSDVTAWLQLGEEVAIDLLTAHARTYAEATSGTFVFGFRRFDGTLQTVTA